jgi:hypothetical protein
MITVTLIHGLPPSHQPGSAGLTGVDIGVRQ